MDTHGCPACPHPGTGPAIRGSPDVNVNRRPAIRIDDPGIHAACCGTNTWTAAKGSQTVYINGKAAHRMGDETTHCGGSGKLIEGSHNVIVGESSSAGGGVGGSRSGGGSSSGGTASSSMASSNGSSGATSAAAASRSSTTPAPSEAPRTFIELELADDEGEPLPFERYRVISAEGTVFSGLLDARGKARIDGVAHGTCAVTFPDLREDDWSPA